MLFRAWASPVVTRRLLPHASRGKGGLPVDDGAGQWPVGVGLGAKTPGYAGFHDVGGVASLLGGAPLDTADHRYALWERQTHALLVLLVGGGRLKVDELRRAIEALHPVHVANWGYYDKWAAAMATLMLERGVVTSAELDEALGELGAEASVEPRFRAGEEVRVRQEHLASRWRKPHLRTPGYIFGVGGVVERYCGAFEDPEFLAFRGASHKQHMYRVRFKQRDVWPEYGGHDRDTVDVEVYESWLLPAAATATTAQNPTPKRRLLRNTARTVAHELHDAGNAHAARHYRDHDHQHLSRTDTEQNAVDLEGPETTGQRIMESLVPLLEAKGVITREGLWKAIEAVDAAGSKAEGPRLIARAWIDADFRERLLQNGNAAAAELGITASNSTTKTVLVAVESTENVHNLVVCTLCSCYPLSILGLSPPWYKSREYRARAVREPRKLLQESFGLSLPDSTSIRVHDSTADCRYIVIPRRPAGTEEWSEEQLQALVTRDTMIGVATCSTTAARGPMSKL